MEYLDFVIVMSALIIAGTVVFRYISMKDAAVRYKAQKEAQISAKNRIAAQQKGKPKPRDIVQDTLVLGSWVNDLADTFGFDPAMLFDDEMPPEVAKLVPLAKGFLDSGGLQKLLAMAGSPGSQQAPGASAQPEMKGGPGWE